jgi:acetyl/propionyl-CoA carboxylase alpha subunit
VLEETPSPLVGADEGLRGRLLAAATSLGAAARYRSAGTVEFLVDGTSREFYFLEVNARLQVGMVPAGGWVGGWSGSSGDVTM